MTTIGPAVELLSVLSPAEQRLLSELHKVIVPFAQAASTGLVYCVGQLPIWLARGAFCPCSSQKDLTPDCVIEACPANRTCQTLKCGAGQLLVCAPESQPTLFASVQQLLVLLDRQAGLEQQEEMLLDELSASWESLEAIYEISTDLNSLIKPLEFLPRILHRATSYRAGLKAVLWLERDGNYHPMAQGVENLIPRSIAGGLLGKVTAERNGLLLNGRDRIAAQPDLEPELSVACNVAIVPLTTGLKTLGILVVWQEEVGGEFDSHDMRFLSALATQSAIIIENERLHRTELESERLRQEIEIGSRIQQMLLRGKIPDSFSGLQVAVLSVPSRMIDGDFYEFIQPHKNCLDIINGDVMGKGIPAALVGAATKSAFQRALNQLFSTGQQTLPEPHEIVARVHEEVVHQLITLESFVTLCYARFDLAAQQVRIVDCGHTAAVRCRPDAYAYELLKGVNLPIGFIEDERYEQSTYPLVPGDLFFFYSDGLTEATNADGEVFGEERMLEMLRRNCRLDPESLVADVHRTVLAFAGRETLGDDLTCVAVRVLAQANPTPLAELRLLSDPRSLTLCRDFVRQACLTACPEVGEEVISELELAVNEAVANVMEHAYREQEDQPIQLFSSTEANQISFVIRHQGLPFDPATAPEPTFDGSKDGGFGLFIISELVDKVVYETDRQGRHTISLFKTIDGGIHGSNI